MSGIRSDDGNRAPAIGMRVSGEASETLNTRLSTTNSPISLHDLADHNCYKKALTDPADDAARRLDPKLAVTTRVPLHQLRCWQ